MKRGEIYTFGNKQFVRGSKEEKEALKSAPGPRGSKSKALAKKAGKTAKDKRESRNAYIFSR